MTWYTLPITWPYYRAYRHFTVVPLRRIEKARGDRHQLCHAIISWKTSKREELGFVKTAGTLSAAANIGIFSWPDIPTTYWLARCCFFFSLLLSVTAVITASQHGTILSSFPDVRLLNSEGLQTISKVVVWGGFCSGDEESQQPGNERKKSLRMKWSARNIEFVWQCPLMMMSWAWFIFLWGITLHICRPLIQKDDSYDARKVAIVSLAFILFGVLVFSWSSFSAFIATNAMHNSERTLAESMLLETLETGRENGPNYGDINFGYNSIPLTATRSQTNAADIGDYSFSALGVADAD